MRASLFCLLGAALLVPSSNAAFKIYVSNERASNVAVFDQNHQYLGSISDSPPSSPRALQMGPNGHLYVAAYGRNNVAEFGVDDSYLGSFGSCTYCTGLAVGNDGRIYAGGFSGVNEGHIFLPDGSDSGTFAYGPSALAVTNGGFLVGVDNGIETVTVMDLDGNFIREWSIGGKPRGVDIGPEGYIYVARGTASDIQVYDLNGTLIRTITSPSMVGPYGIEFSPIGTLYVANFDTGNVLELDPVTGGVLSTIADHLAGPVDVTFRDDCAGSTADGDEDGVPDSCDNCIAVSNPSQVDADADRVGDACDNCVWLQNTQQQDADSDGRGDACDSCPQIADPVFVDFDGDGTADVCDSCTDADGDGFGDPGFPANTCAADNCPGLANASQADADGDGRGDACDNCVLAANADQSDVDADTVGNVCDNCIHFPNADQSDTDRDGPGDACDNCRSYYNPDQIDTDSDGVGNACDNCVAVSNPSQADLDSDSRGDVCDNCSAAYNPLQDDWDGDRRGDACDNCLFDFNPPQSNIDGDTEGDLCDLDDGLIYLFATDPNYVEWQQEAGSSSWNVYEGDLAALRAGQGYTQVPGSNAAADRHCGLVDPWVDDSESFPVGVRKFALVTGVSSGIEGSLGQSSSGSERTNSNPCP